MSSILVLDDDADILFILDRWLAKHGYQVYTFSNSGELLAVIKKFTPDLIILDVRLAEVKDGKTLCSELKLQHHYPNPIFLFSASPMQDADLLTCGADGFIAKPFDLYDLLIILNKALT